MKKLLGTSFLIAALLVVALGAYDGNGTYNRVHSWADDKAASIAITASRMDAEDDGFATGLSTAITKDGQTTITADIPFATFKHSGMGVGTANTDSITLGQAQNGGFLHAGSGGGTVDVITLTMDPVITAYVAGQKFRFLALGANTTTVTVNINSVGALALKKSGGTALAANDIPAAGALIEIVYDGTDFEYSNLGPTVTANVPFSTFKITGLGSGSARTDSLNIGDLQDGSFIDAGTGGGTADVITLTLSPAITAYATGQKFRFLALGANTTTVTVNINSVGALALNKSGGTSLDADDIPAAGAVVEIVYDGTDFEYSNSSGAGGTVVQIVTTQTGALSTGTTTMPGDDTIPQSTEGTEFMTLAITPTSATNKLIIHVAAELRVSTTGSIISMALFQDSTTDALAAVYGAHPGGDANQGNSKSLRHIMTAGTTSATTFKFRAGPDGSATVTFNGQGGARKYGGVSASNITILEVEP